MQLGVHIIAALPCLSIPMVGSSGSDSEHAKLKCTLSGKAAGATFSKKNLAD